MLKKENGVTLVALVITIIVLLILAGVTLAMVMGDSGIFTKANNAAKETRISNARDAVRLAILEVTADQYSDSGVLNNKADYANILDSINDQLQDGYQLAVVDATTHKYKIQQKNKNTYEDVIGSDNTNAIEVTITIDSEKYSVTPTFTNADTSDSQNT